MSEWRRLGGVVVFPLDFAVLGLSEVHGGKADL